MRTSIEQESSDIGTAYDREFSVEQMDTYVNELVQLLARVHSSINHYHALGVAYSASKEELRQAYQRAMTLLSSSHLRINLTALGRALYPDDAEGPGKFIAQVDMSFDRISQAFSVLTNAAKRAEYDKLLLPIAELSLPCSADKVAQSCSENENDKDGKQNNRRRAERFDVSIAAQVIGYDRRNGKWHEATETVDVSQTGATVKLQRRVKHGAILYLSLPLPTEFRSYAQSEKNYCAYAIVRRIEPVKDGRRSVGVEFLGPHPPEGYAEKPWAAFKITRWNGDERRRKHREERAEPVWVEYLNESMQCIRQEGAVTENISKDGMRICVRTPPAEFEMVKVGCPGRGFESFASVCDRFVGDDGIDRLCLRLIDNRATIATAEEAEAQVEKKLARNSVAPRKILVADDDPPLRKVLGKILTDAGYEVILAEDGQIAVEKATAHKPDLVITDGLMPRMHGFLACKSIKELQSPPKVIVLTAIYTKMNYKWEVKEKYGADDMLTKPFEVSELLACIERHLADSRKPAERALAYH